LVKPGLRKVRSVPSFPLIIICVNTLASVTKDVAVISMEGSFSVKDQSVQSEGYDATVSITGKQTGRAEVDIHTGMIKILETSMNADGEVRVMGREVPIKIENRSTVVGARVK
jgi:hypothetical protein